MTRVTRDELERRARHLVELLEANGALERGTVFHAFKPGNPSQGYSAELWVTAPTRGTYPLSHFDGAPTLRYSMTRAAQLDAFNAACWALEAITDGRMSAQRAAGIRNDDYRYRAHELSVGAPDAATGRYRIAVHGAAGASKWLNITADELDAIRRLLTGGM